VNAKRIFRARHQLRFAARCCNLSRPCRGKPPIPTIFASLPCPIRFASGLLAYALLATLVGPTHAETTTRLDAIVGGGTLRVGLTEDYRPFSFADASGKVEGIDVDMAMSLAQSLGVRLEIVKTSWSTLKSDLEANSFDIAMGGITITLDRQKTGLFSNPVFSSGKTPITHCGDEPKYGTIAAIDQPGVHVIVNPGEPTSASTGLIYRKRRSSNGATTPRSSTRWSRGKRI
jgi:extracellular solute-binding protein (family 3)